MWRVIHFFVDFIWPYSRPVGAVAIKEPQWPDVTYEPDTLEVTFELLKGEQAAENERIRIVETKLISLSSFAPVAMAVIVAGFTVLANGKLETFTRGSILMVGIMTGYIAVQLLAAVMAATSGLARRSFTVVRLDDLYPKPKESKPNYLARNCKDLADVIRTNRSEIDSKVTALARGHRAIRNAVGGLVALLITLIVLAVSQSPA